MDCRGREERQGSPMVYNKGGLCTNLLGFPKNLSLKKYDLRRFFLFRILFRTHCPVCFRMFVVFYPHNGYSFVFSLVSSKRLFFWAKSFKILKTFF